MHIVRHHLLAGVLLLLAAQGVGLAAMAQVGLTLGQSTGTACTCGCCRNTPGAHCPMCARLNDAAGKCDCSAGSTRAVELPWWFDLAAMIPAYGVLSRPIPVVGSLPSSSFRLSDASHRPLSPPPRLPGTLL